MPDDYVIKTSFTPEAFREKLKLILARPPRTAAPKPAEPAKRAEPATD